MRNVKNKRFQDNNKEFVKVFNGLCNYRSHWQVWEDFVTAVACSLSNVVDHTPGKWERREEEYAQCVKNLGGNEKLAELFTIVVKAYETEPEQDFLGAMYMELELGNHYKGQFFTPYNVTRMMAVIGIGDPEGEIREKGYMSICDPCVGGGAMLIAAANVMKARGINYHDHAVFVGQDIDRIVGMMAYIQLSLLGCPGHIVIGDSLTNPITGHLLFPEEKEGQEYWYMPFWFKDTWVYRRQFYLMDRMVGKEAQKDKPIYFNFDLEGKLVQENQGKGNKKNVGTDVMTENDSDKENEKVAEGEEGKLEVQEPPKFETGSQKLEYELDQQLQSINDEYRDAYKAQFEALFAGLYKKCEEDLDFNAAVLQGHKSWVRCYKCAGEQAMKVSNPTEKQKELARNKQVPIMVPITMDMVLKWAVDYYLLDDKEAVEKEIAQEKKLEEDKAKRDKRKKAADKKKKIEETEKEAGAEIESAPVEKKKIPSKKQGMEGQASIFDLLVGE